MPAEHPTRTVAPLHTFPAATMCRKTIYYNTYGDGAEDVTERVETCRPGLMCPHQDVRHYSRSFPFTKLQQRSQPEPIPTNKSTPYHRSDFHLNIFPPTPRRSKSPSPSRRRESGVYVNGSKVADTNRRRHSTVLGRETSNIADDRYSRGRVVVVPHAPEPPSPRPALKRTSTMPDFVVVEGKKPTRRMSSREVPIGPVRIVADLGRRNSTYHSQRRARSPSPQRPTYVDDERDERRRRRAERKAAAAAAAAAPGGSDFTQASVATHPMSAATAARKELRWQDQVDAQIAAQNRRISSRPKPHLHQEVKGILKNGAGAPVVSNDDDVYGELRSAVERMDIHGSRASRDPVKDRESREEKRYWDRLRGRFEETSERRRPKVYYPAGDSYNFI